MTLPLLIASAVAAVSSLLPPKSDGSNGSPSSSTSLAMPRSAEGYQAFYTGVVLGMGFSWLVSNELQRTRLCDRIRLTILDLFRPVFTTDEQGPNEGPPKAGTAFSVLKVASENRYSSDQQQPDLVRTIISTSTSLTSTMWVTTICIPPHHELKAQKANGLEFFQVLQGNGKWGNKEEKDNASTNLIVSGEAFVVEANSMRWISNSSFTEDLILLRSSDAGHKHRQREYDQIVLSDSTATVVSRRLSNAVSTGYQQAGAYLKSLVG